MLIGIAVPYYEQYASYDFVVRFSKRADELGFDVIWYADHVALPAYDRPRMGGRWFEMLTLMAHASAHVRRAKIGTDVLVAPYRHPVLAAKALATLDIVSQGRLIIGVGGGYVKEEFEALGAPYAERGPYTDECIRVWKTLWAQGNAAFRGRWFKFSDVLAEPKPVQQPHPPIWIGNRGPRVLRRVAALGDGWHPVGAYFPELEAGIPKLHALWKQAGRAGQPTLSYSGLFGLVTREPSSDPKRLLLTGGIQQVIDDLERLKRMGFASALFRIGVKEARPQDMLAQLEIIASQVLPKVR
jgi:probable F420-dependent oxidoreductase